MSPLAWSACNDGVATYSRICSISRSCASQYTSWQLACRRIGRPLIRAAATRPSGSAVSDSCRHFGQVTGNLIDGSVFKGDALRFGEATSVPRYSAKNEAESTLISAQNWPLSSSPGFASAATEMLYGPPRPPLLNRGRRNAFRPEFAAPSRPKPSTSNVP